MSVLAGVLVGPGDAQAAVKAKRGDLVVRISGLPKGQRPVGKVRGPGLGRRVAASRLKLRNVKPGVYRLTLSKVKISRRSEAVRKGALASASVRTVKVRVRAGRSATLSGRYASIINPGVRSLAGGLVLSVAGPPGDPTSLVLSGRRTFARRTILSIAPGPLLPRGVLSHIVSTTSTSGRTRVTGGVATE